jgi:integrase
MKHKLPTYVRVKEAKGRTYYYYDTGQKDAKGKPILTRLPAVSDPDFGRSLAAATANRNKKQRGPQPLMTVARLIDLFEKSPKFKKKAKGTQVSYNHYLPQIREEMGDAPVNDVSAVDVQMLMDKRGETPAAANQIVRVLGALYYWGRKAKHTTLRPTEDIELNDIGEHMPWPEWLVEEALASDDEMISRTVALLYFTAQRIGDALRMRWSDIRAGRVQVIQEKNNIPLEIRLHERLEAILAASPRRGLTILARADAQPYGYDTVLGRVKEFAHERGHKVVLHGLRKNAVNALLECGCSVAETQAISGQSLVMIEHYAKHRNKAKLGDAAILKWQSNKTGK